MARRRSPQAKVFFSEAVFPVSDLVFPRRAPDFSAVPRRRGGLAHLTQGIGRGYWMQSMDAIVRARGVFGNVVRVIQIVGKFSEMGDAYCFAQEG